MDVSKLSLGERIAGAAGLILLIVMFAFDWFSVDLGGGVLSGVDAGANAWDTMSLIRWILLLTGLAGIGLVVVKGMAMQLDLPVALSAIVTGLGVLSVILIIFRIISPPDGGAGDLIDVNRSIGVFLGLIAAGAVTYGGYLAMQEEGTSFQDQADRLGGGRGGSGGAGGGGGTPPPPPPPPAS